MAGKKTNQITFCINNIVVSAKSAGLKLPIQNTVKTVIPYVSQAVEFRCQNEDLYSFLILRFCLLVLLFSRDGICFFTRSSVPGKAKSQAHTETFPGTPPLSIGPAPETPIS